MSVPIVRASRRIRALENGTSSCIREGVDFRLLSEIVGSQVCLMDDFCFLFFFSHAS